MANPTGIIFNFSSKVDNSVYTAKMALLDAADAAALTIEAFNTAIADYSTTAQVASDISAAVAVETGNRQSAVSGEAEARAAADEALDGRLTTVEGALESLGSLENGSIADALATKVDADDYATDKAALEAADTALDGRLDTVEGDITTLKGDASTAGSVAYAVAGAKSTIDAYTVNGKAISTSPTLSGGDIAITGFTADTNSVLTGISASSTVTAAIDKIDEVVAGLNSSVTTLNGDANTSGSVAYAIKDKVDKVSGSSLVADTEISKLAAYPAYATFSSDIDSRISAAAASVFTYKGTKASLSELQAVVTGNAVGDVWHIAAAGTNGTGAEYVCTAVNSETGAGTWEELGTAVDLSSYDTATQVTGKVDAAKNTIDAYTINSKAISTSPVLGGNDIAITGYTAATNSGLSLTASSTVSAAVTAIDSAIVANTAAISVLNGADSVSGSVAYAVKAEETRATGVEGGLRTDVDANTAAITTLNGNASTAGSVAAAVAAEASRAAGVEGGLRTDVDANAAAITTLNGSDTTAGSVAKAVKDAVDAEATTARAAEGANADAISALQTRATALEGANAYEFISATTTKQLENKLYVVRNAQLTATLPTGTAAIGKKIRLIVNDAAAALGGTITPAGSDTINGGSVYNLNVSMDITLLYDYNTTTEIGDWVVLAILG